MEKDVHWDVLCQRDAGAGDDALGVTAGHEDVVAVVEQEALHCSGVEVEVERICDGCLQDYKLD
jgi:hypothetical protein